MTTPTDQHVDLLVDRRVAFVGKLGGVNRREAQQLVRRNGGQPVDLEQADLIVVGADELPLAETDELLDEATRRAAAAGRVEIITETQLWERLGLMEQEQNVRRLYTPAMLAELLAVSVSTIRGWHRRRLILPIKEVRRLPYFDFQEVATARRLAQLLAAGVRPQAIEQKLAELARYLPDIERPLAQLSVIVEGKQLLLRDGGGLVEPSGQRRFDFEALEQEQEDDDDSTTISLALPEAEPAELDELASPAQMQNYAEHLEEAGQLAAAVEMYRAVLTAGGPRPEICFQLAELLYRLGDISAARERYYMAIELDEDYVEARANLGCVLAETGQLELAVAAFQGALAFHEGYPDVHYHLARTLDELDQRQEAEHHWREFVQCAPDSPWAEEACQRLGLLDHSR